MKLGCFRPPVDRGDLHEKIFRPAFGIFHEHVEVPIVIEDAGVQQFVLHLLAASPSVRLDQVVVGKRRLRIFVEVFHVRMGGRAVEIEVIFLNILSMIGFAIGQSEQALFEDRVFPVPERQRKTEPLLVVRDTGEAVLPPPIGAGAGMFMREVIPRIPAVAIIFPDRSPLPFTQIGSPVPPGLTIRDQSLVFGQCVASSQLSYPLLFCPVIPINAKRPL